MNEKYKQKLEKAKAFAKSHGPAIGFAVIAGVSASLANYYKGERNTYRHEYRDLTKRFGMLLDTSEPFLDIPRRLWDQMDEGAVLKVRRTPVNERDETFVQMTTAENFSDEMDNRLQDVQSDTK